MGNILDGDSPEDVDAPKTSGRTYLSKLINRSQGVELAIGLSRVYEFTRRKDGELALTTSVDSVIPHSFYRPASRIAENAAAQPRLKSFKLARNGSRQIELPIGVTLLLGRSGSGKTRLAFEHVFCSNKDDIGSVVYIKAFEPGNEMSMIAAGGTSIRIPSLEIDLALDMMQFLTSPTSSLLIIDSLRYLFYSSSGGGTGKGGVNMGLFMTLTHLDKIATDAGKHIVVVVNPLSDDEAAFSAYVEAGLGAVSGMIVMQDYQTAEISTRYQTTRSFAQVKLPRRTSLDLAIAEAADESVVDMHSVGQPAAPLSTSIFDRKLS